MKESITDELKGIIKNGENLLRELKGDFAVPGTVRNLTKEFYSSRNHILKFTSRYTHPTAIVLSLI